MRHKFAWVLFIPLLIAAPILAAQEKPSEPGLDFSRRYVVLSTRRYSTLNKELKQAVAAGYAVIMGNTLRKILILEKQPEGAPQREFKVVENLSRDLKGLAEEGYRLIPATVAAKSGMLSIQNAGVVERTPDSQERFEYRMLNTRGTSTLEKDINEAAAQGYRAIALPSLDKSTLRQKNHIAIMERPAGATAQSPAGSATGAQPYLLLATNKSSTLQKELDEAAKKGYCATLGSGGLENMLLLQKCPEDTAAREYLLVATTKSGTFEKEINEAASRGYRPLPFTMAAVQKRLIPLPGAGPYSFETTIVMEKVNAPTAAPTYLVIGTTLVDTFDKELAEAEHNHFEVMGMMLSYTEKVALLQKASSK